ncbi:hypothetical protein B296_00016571 [Ensete ventricosum]|uniref:Uncharacterized protein n=1 Tax=Ensete ventricosum TaxID=4639 RepID=A0A426YTH0_ENSVE|nr:hypothetical protein B296_00016571 [Ensete ventricosum]
MRALRSRSVRALPPWLHPQIDGSASWWAIVEAKSKAIVGIAWVLLTTSREIMTQPCWSLITLLSYTMKEM